MSARADREPAETCGAFDPSNVPSIQADRMAAALVENYDDLGGEGEQLRGKDHHNIWLGYKRSPKRYCVTPDIVGQNIYWVLIEETYRTDLGERRTREWKFSVEVRGIEPVLPLPPKTNPQPDLFENNER